MFSSITVPEGVRRLFQVLTGEDMTDADEGVLFAVADALESGAVEVAEIEGLLRELVGKVRTEFSGKAADRFAGKLEGFDGLLSSGGVALRELAVFVRDLSRQVRYLKLVTIYGLELLLLEMAWAVAMAGATGGASMAWLAARMAVMRMLLSRWWGQLFMRLAMAAAGGVAFNVLPDVQAQLQMLGEKSSEKWDGKLSEQSAGMGAFSALVSLPLSAVGGLVSNALTKVLVKGLGDEVDEAILEAAAKKAVAEHAESYPVSAMARFADVVSKSLDDYAGMSVRAMWSARFGHGVGEALENALSELFGEVAYQAAMGLPVMWNPFGLTAGAFETVFSGLGTLAGLALRGKLHPEGPSPNLDGTSRGDGGTTDGGGFGGEKTPLLGIGSGSQTGDIPGSPGKDSVFIPSDASKPSDVDSVFPVGPVDSATVPVPSGKDPVPSAVVDGTGSNDFKDGTDGTDGRRGAGVGGKEGAGGGVPGGDATGGVPVLPGSGQHRPGTPPPAYPYGVMVFGSDRSVTRPPPYSPVAGGDQAVPGVHGVAGKSGVDVPGMTGVSSVDVSGVDVSGVSSDAVLPETVTPGSGVVADPDGGAVLLGRESLPGGVTGVGGSFGVDVVAGRGDSHRGGGVAASEGSVVLPVEGSQAVSSLRQDGVAAWLAGLPVDAVRVLVPADVVFGGGLVEFVRGGVADSTGGPVVLVAQGNSNAGVVVSPGQGSALARGLGRVVVALTPGRGGRGPRWTVFAADGSRPRPVGGPGGLVPAGGRRGMAGPAGVSAVVPVSGAKTVAPEETPAAQTTSAQTTSAQGTSVVGDPRPAATTHDEQVGTRLPGARPASWREQDLRRVDVTAGGDESGGSGAVPWSADSVAEAQAVGMFSGADSAGVVERGLESMAGQVQPRRGVSRVAERPGLASREGGATGEGARDTSADSADGVRRRRAWPDGVRANHSAAGNESGGAGPKRAPEDAVGPGAVGPGAVGSGVWGGSDPVAGGSVGAWSRFLRGVNQANYFSGDKRFRVNCLEACVAFHKSRKFGRQFAAGPAGDRDPAWLVEALGGKARWVAGLAGAEEYARSVRVGVDVPVIFQRRDGSAHAVNAVHVRQSVVTVANAQKGEIDATADVLAATGVWVIELPAAGPAGGPESRREDGGSGLPAVVTGPKRRGGASRQVAGKAGTKGTKRTRGEADQGSREEAGESSRAPKRRNVQELAAAGAVSGSPGDGRSEVVTPTDQAAQQDPIAEKKRKARAHNAKSYQERKADAALVAELKLKRKGKGKLTEKDAQQLETLEPKVAKRKRQEVQANANFRKAGEAAVARVAELKGKGKLTEEEEEELATLQPRAEKWEQRNASVEQAKKADAARVAELKGKGKLTEEEELAKLEPKVAKRKQILKADSAKWYQASKGEAAARVAELEELEKQGGLSPKQRDELNLRREIEEDVKEVNRLTTRVSRLKKKIAEIEALEALPRSTKDEDKLRNLPDEVARWADSAEELKETRRRLRENREELKSMQARGEAGSGRVAGLEVSGQQDEQSAIVVSGVSEWTGDDRDEQNEWDARSDGSVDLDAWLDPELADSDVPQDAAFQAEWEEPQEELDEAEEQVEGTTRDEGQDLRVARLRESLKQAESDLASFEALQGWDEILRAELATLPTFDQGLRGDWEEVQRGIEALRAELAEIVGDEREPVGEHVGESREGQAAVFVPAVIAELAEVAGRMERHLRTMSPEFNPNGVRKYVETMKQRVHQGQWTPAELQVVESRLGDMQAVEMKLRNARRARVREVYVQAKQAIAQERVPVRYFKDGVPGGVSSRSDVRLGFEVELKLPRDDFDARVDGLGRDLERAGLVDWQTAQGSKLVGKNAAEAILAEGKWALLEEAEPCEVEATSPILRSDTVWPSMEKLLSAVQRQGGYGSESGGHINVSFDWQLTPVQYVRVAQVVKVFEALLFRLGNVAGSDGSKQRAVTFAGPIPLPSDPYAVDDDTGADGYRSLPNPRDTNRAVRFGAVGFVDDRLEFRVWAGDAGERTGNPALWQVRAELSAAMMLAATDLAIYRELDRLMGDPDLLGYDDQTRDEEAWLEKLVEFLELLPLSEAGQAQAVQLFAWTRPWKLGAAEDGYPALAVSLPQHSVLFPAPGVSKAQVVAEAYSYQLYKDASLVVARMTSDRSGIRLRNGQVINFGAFARLLAAHKVGRGWHNEKMWTLLAIPGASAALMSVVLDVVKGPVLATTSDVSRTPGGRLLTGDYELQNDGRLRFRPAREGWIELIKNKHDRSRVERRVTYKVDLGEALMDSTTRLLPDDPAEVYRYWPARAVPVPVGLPVNAVRVAVPVEVVSGGGGLAGFVGGLVGSTGGPVVLVSQSDPVVGVVVSPEQGAVLARGLGRGVVALTPGPVGGTPQWTVFAVDGSAGPVAGSDAGVLAGERGGLSDPQDV
ncbi:WXG100-like domain-containing protein [Saccharopolyspora pogona]|uniref:WXG100-like domain-containing protein n=1 Tax=Saccharopolyspora pogona TaxID=333966 RepID=UPI001CC231E8|nr:hypothetical protein [Saccharopolyspora pogona]